MLLGFKQFFPWGEPTHFKEKILSVCYGGPTPKFHTLRIDPHDRWKAGRKIEMAYGVRTKHYEQFNKGIPELEKCVSTQKIQMRWIDTKMTDKRSIQTLLIFIDNKAFPFERYEELFANDGFNSTVDFFRWFQEDFIGKIIHFTTLRY